MRTFTQDFPNGRPECEFGNCRGLIECNVVVIAKDGKAFRTPVCARHAEELIAMAEAVNLYVEKE